MFMTSSEQERHLLIQIQLSRSKAVLVPNVSAKFDQIKDEEAAPILIYTVFSNFLYSTEQR